MSVLALILVVLWLGGLLSGTTPGPVIHLLLLMAILLLLTRLVRGPRLAKSFIRSPQRRRSPR